LLGRYTDECVQTEIASQLQSQLRVYVSEILMNRVFSAQICRLRASGGFFEK
jgi:hypothetical protein